MPELGVETSYTCRSNSDFEIEVKGSKGNKYKVTYGPLRGNEVSRQEAMRGWECSCPAFYMRKKGDEQRMCKHIKQTEREELRCGWNEGGEAGMMPDTIAGELACPQCGGPVESFLVAV